MHCPTEDYLAPATFREDEHKGAVVERVLPEMVTAEDFAFRCRNTWYPCFVGARSTA